MIPVLHHNDTGSINIQYLNRGQEGYFLLAILSVDDWLQPDRRGDDDIWSIEVWEVDNLFLFRENLNTHSKEIILIVLVLLYFLLVFNLPLQRSSLLFILLSLYKWLLLYYRICNFLIFHKLLFNEIKDSFSITNVWSENEIFRICESSCFFTLFQCLDTVYLVFIHMTDYYFPEFLDGLLFIVLDMNVIDVIVDDGMSDLVLFRKILCSRALLLLHWCRWFLKFRVLKCKLRGSENITFY